MNPLTIPGKQMLTERDRIDWNSLFLLLMLTVPAALMWVMLLLWPGATWVAQVPSTAIEVLGSFTVLLLAVFLIARYKDQPGTLYMSAGLTGMAVLEGFFTVAPVNSSAYVWLHSAAGIFGGVFMLFAVMTRFSHPLMPRLSITTSARRLIIGCAVVSFVLGVLAIVFSGSLPATVAGARFTTTAWLLNAMPVALFLSAGVSLFYHYRKTGAQDLFLFTAIVIFLFQANEVFYFASPWSLIWWFWQSLRLVVYFSVLCYVLKEYIQTSDSLAGEIVERQRAEIALRKAEADWRNSFNSLDDVMLIIDRDFTIRSVNEAGLALVGLEGDQVVGEKCFQVFHGNDRADKDCPCRRSFRTRKPAQVEHNQESFGRYFSYKSAPIINGSDKPEKCVCLMRDITREIRARDKERELQQELNLTSRLASIGEVAAGIAHEINNPLTGVIGFAQLLSDMNIPDEMREAVEVIQDGASRTAGIVQKLLTFARQNKATREYIDVNSVLKSTIDIRAYELRTNNIEVIRNLAADLPKTVANFGQLQQVLLNLIVNAEQAMQAARQPGRLQVKSESSDGKIRITVSDNGVGISKENLGKLFDPFFTTKADNGGTGLGLSISYGIIKEHNGDIRVKSVAGEGATFTIVLPVVLPEKKAETPGTSLPPLVPVKNARIMVIDDEVNICRVLHRILAQEGHRVDTAYNAEAGLELLQINNYDLILLDIKMPGMSGIDLFNRMKDIDPLFPQKVVFLTGDIISPRNKTFLEETGVNFVTKPFTGDALMRHVNATVGGNRCRERYRTPGGQS